MALEALFDAAPSGKIELACETCGKRFERHRSQIRNKDRAFCSIACRYTGREYACAGCGSPVYRKRYQADRIDAGELEPWCSRECISKHKRYRGTCANCQQEFSTPQSHLKRDGRGTYCSRECKDNHRREPVRCAWPGCTETMMARSYVHAKGFVTYKTDLTKKGSYNRFPLCAAHKELCRTHLGHEVRPNGNLRWLDDPEHDLGSRTLGSKITRLVIFFKNGGNCSGCGVGRRFDKTDDWHIDHTLPVYKGGKTNFHNLQMLCVDCHSRKTAAEKSEVALLRGRRTRLGRWMTHPQKDAVIVELRAENARLKALLKLSA